MHNKDRASNCVFLLIVLKEDWSSPVTSPASRVVYTYIYKIGLLNGEIKEQMEKEKTKQSNKSWGI